MYTELRKFKVLEQVSDLEIVNLGTGMGYYDFCYEDIPLKAFNFALLQQNLYFDYQLLKNYAFKMKKKCKVCIVCPYFIFCADRLEEALPRYERYYMILPPKVVEPYCGISYEEWKQKEKEVVEEDISLKHVLSNEEMVIQSEDAIENWIRSLKIISLISGEVAPQTKTEIKKSQMWLKNILEFCEKMEFIPVIIVPPMSQTLLEKIGLKFREMNFYNVIKETVSGSIRILDYSEDTYFCEPKLYGWPGFLAEGAAREFTRDVLHKLYCT